MDDTSKDQHALISTRRRHLGNSTCTSYYKCKNCGQTVNKRVGDHTCGNVYCKTCKDYYPSGHQCYMLPVDYNDRQKKQTYIFFDFECTQDDRIQCQQEYQSDDNENHCKSPRCGAFEHISAKHVGRTNWCLPDLTQLNTFVNGCFPEKTKGSPSLHTIPMAMIHCPY